MARPLALAARPGGLAAIVRDAGAGLLVLLLGAFVLWPVATVILHGLVVAEAGWPWAAAVDTLVVALAATLGAVVPAGLIGLVMTRVDIRGRRTLWQIFKFGILIPPFSISLALLTLTGPHGLLAEGWPGAGLGAIAIGQALAFLPLAVVLVVGALARVPVELEQAAEILGASRTTVARRVTIELAGPAVLRAALVVLGLCLADVATPLLLGGEVRVLATVVVATAAIDAPGAARAALTLTTLALGIALVGGAWRPDGMGAEGIPPRLERRAPPALRWSLGVSVWAVAAVLAGLWAVVPLASLLARDAGGLSLEHWSVVATAAGARAVGTSVVLGLGVALAGTVLALAAARIVERRRGSAGRAVEALTRIPLVTPGVVAGVGYVLLFAGPPLALSTLPVLIVLVACWELPATARAARDELARSDRSVEEAAISLGAGVLTTLTRVVAPGLGPLAARMAAHLFAAGVLAVGTVIVLAGAGGELGALTLLALAAGDATGAACAIATVLLVLAGGALLLGRALAGRQRGFTPRSAP